jgi:RNA polymerase sigma-70 factor, ECF subfamily
MARLSDQEFIDLLEQHRHEFYRYVLRTVWNDSAAEDVFASAVMAAFEQLHKFEKGTNFRAWMYRILTNKCFVANRETQRHSIDIESIDEGRLAVEPSLSREALDDPEWFLAQCSDEVLIAMKSISSAERACLMLRTVEKLSYKEIASTLEIPVGTVMTHLARGRARLRLKLSEFARDRGILKNLADPRDLKGKTDATWRAAE